MKKLKQLFTFLLLAAGLAATAQDRDREEASLEELVESGNFLFKARTAIPSAGPSIFLTSEYDLWVSKDSISSFLPYFGRAFTAPVDPRKNALEFISTQFDYRVMDGRKGWTVTIQPKNTEVREMTLFISAGGNATLQVISNNRQAISFNGEIRQRI